MDGSAVYLMLFLLTRKRKVVTRSAIMGSRCQRNGVRRDAVMRRDAMMRFKRNGLTPAASKEKGSHRWSPCNFGRMAPARLANAVPAEDYSLASTSQQPTVCSFITRGQTMSFAIPANESGRLDALRRYEILDT